MRKNFFKKIKKRESLLKQASLKAAFIQRILKKRLPHWAFLMIVCMIWGLLLGSLHELLKDKITANELPENTILASAYSGAEEFVLISRPQGFKVDSCFEVYNNGEQIGYVIGVSEKGKNGNIQVQVGIDMHGCVVGTYIDPKKHNETRDIGGDAIESSEFQSQFIGGSEGFVIGKNVDAITFATISSSAVIRAVNRAIEAARSLIATQA